MKKQTAEKQENGTIRLAAIKGVVIKPLKTNSDDRGWLTEIFREDETDIKPAMSYVSFTRFGVKRGPHEHEKQSDFFIFTGPGDFELHLWDNRKGSSTFGKSMKIIVGESYNASVIVPPHVIHGYKAISRPGSYSINLPDRLYAGRGKKESVDEIRHEEDSSSKYNMD